MLILTLLGALAAFASLSMSGAQQIGPVEVVVGTGPDANAPALITGLHIRVDQQIDGLHRIATIPPRGHMRVWFDTRPGPGHVDLSLPADGATITLITSEGVEFATMKYARQRNGVSEGRRPDGSSGTVKFTKGATPGAPNIVPSYDVPRLNEVLAFNRNGPSDWVELYNDTGSGVSLDGVSLSRRDAGAGDWTFPAGTTIKKGGTVVVRFDGNQPAGGFNTGVSLPADGGGWLYHGHWPREWRDGNRSLGSGSSHGRGGSVI